MKRYLVLMFLSLPVFAQDLQNRSAMHLAVDLNNRVFIPVWLIGNARTQTPGNFNLIGGLGVRGENAGKSKTWWLEGMVWRQWKRGGDRSWALDFRHLRQWKDGKKDKANVYLEAAPFLSQRGFYELVYAESRLGRGIMAGGETENIHRAGRDSFGAGPRISRTFSLGEDLKVTMAFSCQFRPHEPNALRLWLIFFYRDKR